MELDENGLPVIKPEDVEAAFGPRTEGPKPPLDTGPKKDLSKMGFDRPDRGEPAMVKPPGASGGSLTAPISAPTAATSSEYLKQTKGRRYFSQTGKSYFASSSDTDFFAYATSFEIRKKKQMPDAVTPSENE